MNFTTIPIIQIGVPADQQNGTPILVPDKPEAVYDYVKGRKSSRNSGNEIGDTADTFAGSTFQMTAFLYNQNQQILSELAEIKGKLDKQA